MRLQQLLSVTRKAIDGFGMIEEGDHIAVGLSGGKDSLALLTSLRELQRFYPKKYSLTAVTVDLGFPNVDYSLLEDFCVEKGVPYKRVETAIADIVFYERREKNPCSLCAKMRKGALNDAVKALGCNKVAYAHHKDDIVETMLLSLIYEGRFHSFSPVTYLDRMDLTLIRPLMYVPEADIIGFQNKFNLPTVKNPCPQDGVTKREYVKQVLRQLNLENPGVKNRMFTAIVNGKMEGWPDKSNLKREE